MFLPVIYGESKYLHVYDRYVQICLTLYFENDIPLLYDTYEHTSSD